MISRRLVLVASITLLQACTTLQTQNLQPGGLKAYRRAYVEMPLEDEFQVVPANDRRTLGHGFRDCREAVCGADRLRSPSEGHACWWLGHDAVPSERTDSVYCGEVGPTRHLIICSKGLWLGVRDGRLKTVFNDIRQKNGYPPSKQFP